MRPTGFITLQFSGSQTKDNRQSDSSFPPSVCSAPFIREGTSRRDTRKIGNFKSDRAVAKDKVQQQDLRQLCVVAALVLTTLPAVAGFTKDEI